MDWIVQCARRRTELKCSQWTIERTETKALLFANSINASSHGSLVAKDTGLDFAQIQRTTSIYR